MNPQSDQDLLREYAARKTDAVFRELVQRHIDLVHSTALRTVRDAHLAQDVTQSVFLALAGQAGQLIHHGSLAGWLYRTTRNLSANAVRAAVRRRTHEEEAMAMKATQAPPSPEWDEIALHLDAALAALKEQEREAVLLRYFEHKSAREIGQLLGDKEEAVQKRISRAMEKLRGALENRGITVSTAVLVTMLSTQAVQAAPVGLAAAITSAAALTASASGAGILAFTNAIVMTTFQKTIVAVVATACVAVPLGFQQRAISLKDQENELLRKELQKRPAMVASPALRPAMAAGLTDDERSELLRLRGEAGLLRQRIQELEAQTAARVPVAPRSSAPGAAPRQEPQDVASAKAIILSNTTGVDEKLTALRALRTANERPPEVVGAMVQAYHTTDNPEWRADIFRQLSGTTHPDLKNTLLHAVADQKLNSKVREEAAETLTGFLPDPDVKQWLEHLAASDADLDVRSQANKALADYSRKQRQK